MTVHPPSPDLNASWEFTLTRDLVTPDEQSYFAEDLERLGLDEIAWLILNGSAATGTATSVPKVLRGYQKGKLAGVAYITECRSYGRSLFTQERLAALVDLAPLPLCIWLRHGALTDCVSNPGFVAQEIEREQFLAQAISFLRQRYFIGGIVEGVHERTLGNYAAFAFCDYGIVELQEIRSVNDLFSDSKNLKRKVNKFRNKGGTIEVISGALGPAHCDAVAHCLNNIKAVLVSPFQDNYHNLVQRASAHEDQRIIHLLARLEGEIIGYHSFARSGKALHCLSGAFDRSRHTNYHAYENLILASMNLCLEQGLSRIYYGPVVNESKVKMMSRFVNVEQRYFMRHALLLGPLQSVMAKTRLTSSQLVSYSGLESSALAASQDTQED